MKTTDWKDELKKKWYLHTRKEGQQPYKAELSFTTCEEEVIEFIESLLKKQRESCAGQIHKMIVPQSKAEYIHAILNAPEPGGSDGMV